MAENKLIFALDVGTRKVCGLLLREVSGQARIIAFSVREHSERAMMDGQVHFIEKAAQVVRHVKEDLEIESGEVLNQAHVAVAGRALLTREKKIVRAMTGFEPLDRRQLLPLELQAVKEAKLDLADARAASGSYCVGYTVTRQALDGTLLKSLEGHVGKEIEITVLATFLPKLVLDSLQAVLRAAGLSLASLTLEPIAALEIAIPADLRRLNLCLVDVGAGTSDIAITRDGVVTAFAMVPLAGDEVSEALCDKYLLEFEQAEALKRGLADYPQLEVRDIFGSPVTVDCAEAKLTIAPIVENLANEVSARILALNNAEGPQAVLLVGGGSQVEGLDRLLAQRLGIPPSRVGHRPPNLQKDFVAIPDALNAVWAITPLGIALTAMRGSGLPFASFRVNDHKVQVLNLNQSFTAFDALLASGREVKEFYGKPGLALGYTLNGMPRVVKGGMGTPARLLLNGQEAEFDRPIDESSSIVFHEAVPGRDGAITAGQALRADSIAGFEVSLNGESREVLPRVMINGAAVPLDAPVPDRANIVSIMDARAEALLSNLGFDLDGLLSRDITVRIDGNPKILHQRNYRLKVNGRECPLGYILNAGDKVEFEPGGSFQERIRDLFAKGEQVSLSIKLNGDWIRVPVSKRRVRMNGREVSADEYLIDGAEITTEARDKPDISVGDLLGHVSLDTSRMASSALKLTIDGQDASDEDMVIDGSEVVLNIGQADG